VPDAYNSFQPENPLPNSKPFVAGSDIAALASSASSLSKTGEPSPWHTITDFNNRQRLRYNKS
jgi:hypothetical protein